MRAISRDTVMEAAVRMLEYAAQCARRGPHGEWVINPEDRNGDVATGATFLADMARGAKVHPDVVEVEPPRVSQRPIDAEWVRRCDAMAEATAKETRSLVVQMVIRDGGKVGISVGGEATAVGEEKVLAEMMKRDPVRFFISIANGFKLLKQQDALEPRQ